MCASSIFDIFMEEIDVEDGDYEQNESGEDGSEETSSESNIENANVGEVMHAVVENSTVKTQAQRYLDMEISLQSLLKPALKARLAGLNLKTSGNKPELIRRLVKSLLGEAPSPKRQKTGRPSTKSTLSTFSSSVEKIIFASLDTRIISIDKFDEIHFNEKATHFVKVTGKRLRRFCKSSVTDDPTFAAYNTLGCGFILADVFTNTREAMNLAGVIPQIQVHELNTFFATVLLLLSYNGALEDRFERLHEHLRYEVMGLQRFKIIQKYLCCVETNEDKCDGTWIPSSQYVNKIEEVERKLNLKFGALVVKDSDYTFDDNVESTRSTLMKKLGMTWISTGRKSDGILKDAICSPFFGILFACCARPVGVDGAEHKLNMWKTLCSLGIGHSARVAMDRGYASMAVVSTMITLGICVIGILTTTATSNVLVTVVKLDDPKLSRPQTDAQPPSVPSSPTTPIDEVSTATTTTTTNTGTMPVHPVNPVQPVSLQSDESASTWRAGVVSGNGTVFVAHDPKCGDQTVVVVSEASGKDQMRYWVGNAVIGERLSYHAKGKDQYIRLALSFRSLKEVEDAQRSFVAIPRQFDQSKSVFPTQTFERGVHGDALLVELRHRISRYSRALTVTDCDAVWYAFRTHLVTGTVAVKVINFYYKKGDSAILDPILFASVVDEADCTQISSWEDDERNRLLAAADERERTRIAQQVAEGELNQEANDEEDDNELSDDESDHEESPLQQAVSDPPVIQVSSSEAALQSTSSDQPPPSSPPPPPSPSPPSPPNHLQQFFCSLLDSWYSPSFRPPRHMVEGKRNEVHVLKMVESFRCVERVGTNGLLQSTDLELEHLGATMDGIAVVKILDEEGNPKFVDANIEIKSHFAETERKLSLEIGETLNNNKRAGYFDIIDASSHQFRKVVRFKHHVIQMLTQCVVNRLNYSLYVVAHDTTIVYSVLIFFSDDTLNAFGKVLAKAQSVLDVFNPLHTASGVENRLVGKDIITRIKEKFPAIPIDRLAVIESHLAKNIAVWRWFFLDPGFPLPPVRRIKPLLTHMYNRLKGGVDRWSKLAVKAFRLMSLHHSPHALVTWRMFLMILVNAFQCGKISEVYDHFESSLQDDNHISAQKIANRMKKQSNLVQLAFKLGKQILQLERTSTTTTERISVASPMVALSVESGDLITKMQTMATQFKVELSSHVMSSPGRLNLAFVPEVLKALTIEVGERSREWYATPEGTALRRTPHYIHSQIQNVNPRYCKACSRFQGKQRIGNRTRTSCSICKAFLCKGCWNPFHEQELLKTELWFFNLLNGTTRALNLESQSPQ